MLSGILTVGMYAVNFLIVAMTVLTAVETLSGEIASGTIQAIAMKPMHRWELLCGKWLGFSGRLTLYALVMILGMDAITLVFAGVSARHLAVAFGLMWMESMLLLSTTLRFGVSLSALTTGAAVLGLHGLAFLAGWIEQAGSLTRTPGAVTVAIVASLIMPSEALWRRAAFEMQSPLTTRPESHTVCWSVGAERSHDYLCCCIYAGDGWRGGATVEPARPLDCAVPLATVLLISAVLGRVHTKTIDG